VDKQTDATERLTPCRRLYSNSELGDMLSIVRTSSGKIMKPKVIHIVRMYICTDGHLRPTLLAGLRRVYLN